MIDKKRHASHAMDSCKKWIVRSSYSVGAVSKKCIYLAVIIGRIIASEYEGVGRLEMAECDTN